jgi:Family of unknown function (DUF6599)
MPLAGAFMIAMAVSAAAPVLPDEVTGWKAQAPAVRYDAQTIFHYIDGHGEVYLAYGMSACEARRYAGPAGEGEVVADVFEMASPADAYGVFTHSREGEPVDVGQDATFGYGTLSFWKGRFFVSVLAEQESERTRAVVLALGRAVAEAIPGTGERPALVGRLPAAGLDPASVVFLRHPRILEAHVPVGPDNPLGVGPSAPAATARYRLDGGTADLVVVDYADAEGASSAGTTFAARFLDGERPAHRDDGWCAAAALGDRARAFVLRAPSREAALSLLAEATKGARP